MNKTQSILMIKKALVLLLILVSVFESARFIKGRIDTKETISIKEVL